MKQNSISTYIVILGYSRSLSEIFPLLKSMLLKMNFSTIVADKYGMPRELGANTFSITGKMSVADIEDLIHILCLDLPDFQLELKIVPVDDYFTRLYR
ncbi:type V toxin-antitoxin system endoribonuclease antitoxin GhoS [Salmonella enterica]|nr:endoribonuclease GhoS [Salmonella enterica subsp. diarizonae serovar 48:i:z]EEH1874792.1 type V toxin-antitoxin system endoribonuclease antitoxin GhoS [Salmonella enterica]EEM2738227.1 type V toxin-antitoxin system endoribonuclease antitoxin GhoS [Salmonella enterica]EEM9675678.1 type V toxin-antitoxin system endoribonuclease antitoxin GhoS [Salmonella enterica]EEN5934649.1 type V toxin-antitoxin system endoribonuclease antitoxin GhoS [Salmonella enterica]